MIPKANDAKALRFERRRPLRIVVRAVLPAIDLHNQPGGKASEVRDVRRQRVLKPELESIDLAVAHCLPEAIFGIRPVAAQPGSIGTYLAAHRRHDRSVE